MVEEVVDGDLAQVEVAGQKTLDLSQFSRAGLWEVIVELSDDHQVEDRVA